MIRSLTKTVLDLVYPRQCQICGNTAACDRFPFLCKHCFAEASLLEPPWCDSCMLPIEGEVKGPFRCPNCGDRELFFERARAVMRFRGPVRHAIHGLKYSRQMYWSQVLTAWFLAGAVSCLDRADIDLAMPVPLHPVRERERGFNQAWILLSVLAGEWKLPSVLKGLVRIRRTETQTHLDRDERMLNLKGAFAVKDPGKVRGKRVLLVDDVLTTGSTANECSRVLKEAGAISVLVFTLARG